MNSPREQEFVRLLRMRLDPLRADIELTEDRFYLHVDSGYSIEAMRIVQKTLNDVKELPDDDLTLN